MNRRPILCLTLTILLAATPAAAATLTINFGDDLTNPPEFLNLPTASNNTAVMIPAGPDSYGHMTIAHPAVWAPALQSFLQRLPHED